ncbi:MAG: class F sortase [Patescibacteria group bacterium]
MHKKILNPVNIILTLAALAVVLFGLLVWRNVFTPHVVVNEKSEPEIVINNETPDVSAIGLPQRLKIPSIAVDAAVEAVGLTDDGSMAVPQDPLNGGWYELGPRPGETGSAVIAGHVDWYNGATGVFEDLNKLKTGDKITLEDSTGQLVSFIVRDSRTYDAEADATDVFTSNDNKAHLNLITCSGTWDKNAKQYATRLVVFADKD